MIKALIWLLLLPFRVLGRIYRFLRTVWQFGAVLIIVLLIGVNVATLTFDVANRILSSLVNAVAGDVSLRSKAEAKFVKSQNRVVALEADVDRKYARMTKLDEKVTRQNINLAEIKKERTHLLSKLDAATADLNAEKLRQFDANKQLRTVEADLVNERELRRHGAIELESERNRKASMINDVDSRTRRVVRRSGIMVARDVASMPLEAVPWLGIATIVGATTWEAKDLCATARDMQEICKALGISDPLTTGTNEICSVEIPSVQELWARTVSGKDAEIAVRCRKIRALGLPVPDECPMIPILPPLPDTAPTEASKPGPLPRFEEDTHSTSSPTYPGPLLQQE